MMSDPKNPQETGAASAEPAPEADKASHAVGPTPFGSGPVPHGAKPAANDEPETLRPEAEDFAEIEAALDGRPRFKHHDDLIAELRRENSDLRDKALRAHAEVDNIRKRTDREKDDTAKYAVTRFARDMLAVTDNMQRAMAAVPVGAVDNDPALKSLLDGVTLTERELLNALERHGVRRIPAENAIFNPHLHQAVMEIENPAVPAGTVVQVFQSGFSIEDRVLRPAMVVVARGGGAAKTSAATEPADGDEPQPT